MRNRYMVALFCLMCGPGAAAQHLSTENEWFRKARNEPLFEIPVRKTIDVTSLGAVPDDGRDDSKAIAKAFRMVSDGGEGMKIHFPAGTYHVSSDNAAATHCFRISDGRNFMVEADGADIVITDPTKGFLKVENCSNAIIRGFRIDYSALPYTQGIIRSVDRTTNTFSVEIGQGYPSPLADHFEGSKTKWASLFERDGDRITLKRGAPNLISVRSVTACGEGVYAIQTRPSAIEAVEVGDMYAMIARYNGRPSYSLSGCENITLVDNVNYAGPAGGFALRGSSNVNILSCRVERKPGRFISQNADCVHVLPATIGPRIEGCTFEGQQDDAVNIKTEMVNIIEVLGPDLFLVRGTVSEGDTLSLYNPREGLLVGRCAVMSVVSERARSIVRTDTPFDGLKPGTEPDADMFFNDNRSNESFVIRNNRFLDSRRYGVLIQGTRGVIENNEFRGTSTGAITMQNSASWPEGFVPRYILISGNTISDCGFDQTYLRFGEQAAPVLLRTTTCVKDGAALWKGVSDIEITRNIISGNGARSIRLSGARDVRITDNVLSRDVLLENTENITLSGNTNPNE